MENNPPARDLYDPLSRTSSEGMRRVGLARHGGQPASAAPGTVLPGTVLPGAINVGFVDGHAEQVKLQDLWTCRWQLHWRTPSPRPS